MIFATALLVVVALFNTEAFRPLVPSFARKHHSFVLKAAWGDDVVFEAGTVRANAAEATGMKLITVDVPDGVKDGYMIPGQYCQMKIGDGKAGFYAIASAPSTESNTFTFLIKENENNGVLTSAPVGTQVQISAPQGKGFAIEENFDQYKFDFPTMRVVMMACGSGLAPIAAAIDSGELKLKEVGYNSLFARQGVLYIGARTEKHLPFKDKYKEWEDKGVTVVPVLSKPSASWTGKEGRIQDILKKDGVEVPRNTGVLLCGHKGMVDDAKEIFLEAGCYEGRLLLNF
jgi:NAD(P)H-flavin reductase